MSAYYLFLAMGVMALGTFALRAFPFIVFRKAQGHPWLEYFGETMPPGIMLILVVYSLSGVNFEQLSSAGAAVLSVAVVVSVQHLWHRPLLSISAGTILYSVLLQSL